MEFQVLFLYWCILELDANILVRMYSSTVAPAKYYGYDIVMPETQSVTKRVLFIFHERYRNSLELETFQFTIP